MLNSKIRHMLLACASVASLALYAPAMAQSADDQAAQSDDVVSDVVAEDETGVDTGVDTDVVEVTVDESAETTVGEEVVDPVPVEWVLRDGEPDVMMYSMMGGMEDPAEDIAARAAEQAATQAMDQIDATDSEAPIR